MLEQIQCFVCVWQDYGEVFCWQLYFFELFGDVVYGDFGVFGVLECFGCGFDLGFVVVDQEELWWICEVRFVLYGCFVDVFFDDFVCGGVDDFDFFWMVEVGELVLEYLVY